MKAGPFTGAAGRALEHRGSRDLRPPALSRAASGSFIRAIHLGRRRSAFAERLCIRPTRAIRGPCPRATKNMLIGDIGNIPEPANLFDAQVALRKAMEPWVIPAASTTGFVSLDRSGPRRIGQSPRSAADVARGAVFISNGDLVGTVAEAPFALDWAGAYPGRHEVFLEMVDTLGGITPLRPRARWFSAFAASSNKTPPDLHYSATGKRPHQ